MRALVHRAPRDWVLQDLTIPDPREDEVLLQVEAAGFCPSDWKIYLGYKPVPSGTIPGHEIAARVLYDPDERLDPGEPVVVYPIIPCDTCPACEAGMTHQCERKISVGYDRHGGFAEKLVLPGKVLFRTTEEDPERRLLVEPLATVVWGLTRARVREAHRILILGLGPMGLLHSLALKEIWEKTHVWGWDPHEQRRAFAQRFSGLTPELPQRVDLAILATGSTDALQLAMERLEPGGTLLLYASYYRETPHLDANEIHYRELQVVGTHSVPLSVFLEVRTLMEDGLDPTPIITHRYPLEGYTELLARYAQREGLKFIFRMDASTQR